MKCWIGDSLIIYFWNNDDKIVYYDLYEISFYQQTVSIKKKKPIRKIIIVDNHRLN